MSLPPHRHAAVARGLEAAFGVSIFDAIIPLSGGLSGADVYRIEVGGAAYMLRIQDRRDAVRDPARMHACMRIAAQAGVAPAVLYASDEDGVTITDFIASRPPARETLLPQLARLLRDLHDAPAFPPLVDYLDGLEGLVDQVLASPLPPPGMAREIQRTWDALKPAYRRLQPDAVSSHNDVNPGNIVHEGVRPWLVDWDAAFLADRYVDLSAVANVYAPSPEVEAVLLTAYFGAPATQAQHARLHLARQISHMFHAMIFLVGAAGERPGASLPEAPDDHRALAGLHMALGAGEPLLSRWEGRVAYGLAHLREAVAAIDAPRFAEAVRLAL